MVLVALEATEWNLAAAAKRLGMTSRAVLALVTVLAPIEYRAAMEAHDPEAWPKVVMPPHGKPKSHEPADVDRLVMEAALAHGFDAIAVSWATGYAFERVQEVFRRLAPAQYPPRLRAKP